jgi:hypothetical protein
MTHRPMILSTLSACGVAWFLASALTGCNIAGGAYPEKDGPKFLTEHGISNLLAERVVQGDPLDPAELECVGSFRDLNVRFLLARNPHLPPETVDRFIRDRNDFVRSGAARNSNLTALQIETLLNDSSHTVLSAIAQNPVLSDELQMRLHRTRRISLLYFAMNPNCAAPLRDAILGSQESDAKYWLKVTQEWIAEGIFVKGSDGRWKRNRVSQSPRELTAR